MLPDVITDKLELEKIFSETNEKFLVPPAHLQDFESNTVGCNKTINDLNVETEIEKLQNKIVDLENQIDNLRQTTFNLLSVINSVVSTYNVGVLNNLQGVQQTCLQSSLYNPYYNSSYALGMQSCCNNYKGYL